MKERKSGKKNRAKSMKERNRESEIALRALKTWLPI
jgi:hypothetical protein